MIGAIIGDIVGSRYEFNNIHHKDFEFFHAASTFTDDTVLTVATADVILHGGSYLRKYQSAYFDYPNRGWGGRFMAMAQAGNLQPYDSYGNGSAMRVSPVGWAFNTVEETLAEAKRSAEVTHNHPEGVKGAMATALAIYLARHGSSKEQIMNVISNMGYDLSQEMDDIPLKFDETCQGTIPVCMAIFNASTSYEDCIRNAISKGGDCDTTACISGAIAEAFYGFPPDYMVAKAYSKIPDPMRRVVTDFIKQHVNEDFVEPTETMTVAEKLQDAFRSIWSI